VRDWRSSPSYRDGVRHPILVSLLVVAAGAAACAKTREDALPPVVPTVPTTSTTLIDYSTVPLAAVQGNPTTTVNQGPGRARLSGTVVGPDGPVPLAIVRVERLQDDAVVFKGDITTDAEGKWRTGRLVGGRWRARAWRAPDLADVRPDTVYLEASQSKSLQLKVDRYGAPAVTASVAPDPPVVGANANVAVVVTTASVDAEGIVRSTPIPNFWVQLVAPTITIAAPNSAPSDAAGRIGWVVSCTLPGPSGALVNLQNGASQAIDLPPCAEPPPPPQPAAGTPPA
jgi:hypothetical protein